MSSTLKMTEPPRPPSPPSGPPGRDILFAVEADLAVSALAGNDLDLCNINKHSVVLLSSGSMQQYYDH